MTIKNFTFFSPNGTEFPVGSNNDGKLYMMLTGMDYGTIRRKDWSTPLNTALNVQYTNTSIVAGGRYFELLNETVALTANSVNYIHANIDLTKTTNPVSLSAETANNSNNVDLNNSSGVLKVVIDIRTTDGTGVISANVPDQVTQLDTLKVKNNKVYGRFTNGIWQVEQISDTEYKFTTTETFSLAISGAVGQMFASQPRSYPALPSGYTKTQVLPTVVATANWCWAIVDNINQYRLATFSNTAATSRTVKIEIIATKN
jgi:hypothetical protein